jgi:energy-coupling factor transport system ATP-binding protein
MEAVRMIHFDHVSFSYPGQETGSIHDLNLSIQDGECVLFCGRSGCGKTTVIRLINGLIPSFFTGKLSGRVTVGSMNTAETPMYRIAKHVGSVFQNPRPQFFNVDTDSEIAFGIENEALPPGELYARVNRTAEELHIQDLRGRNIFALSGGEKQKIAFASIYAMRPDVYLLDEPSSNLDMKSIDDLKGHLKLIKAQGKTIVIAEHRLYYLMEIVDRIIHLEQGQAAGVYTPAELAALPDTKRSSLGLRAVDLYTIWPQKRLSFSDRPTLELRDVTFRY